LLRIDEEPRSQQSSLACSPPLPNSSSNNESANEQANSKPFERGPFGHKGIYDVAISVSFQIQKIQIFNIYTNLHNYKTNNFLVKRYRYNIVGQSLKGRGASWKALTYT